MNQTGEAKMWWGRQSRRRKLLAIGGAAAVVLIGVGAAAGDAQVATKSVPTTVGSVAEGVTAPASTAVIVTEAPTIPPTTPQATTIPPTTVPVTYTVSGVIDGDTIDVIPSDGSAAFRVRMVGIDAPESGSCEADAAQNSLSGMVSGRLVVLTPGAGEDTDQYGRYLRYVDVDGADAGLRLVEGGLAVARYDSRDGYGTHTREASYVAADDASPNHMCAPPTTQAPATTAVVPTTQAPAPQPVPVADVPAAGGTGCDPNYSGCVPIDSDVDCAGGSGNGPSYTGMVQIIGSDVYDLDSDGDGVACE